MAKDPWKDPDPQPGDFDARLDHAQIETHEGNPSAKLPGEVVSELLRSA